MLYDRIADEYPVREVLRRYGVKFSGTAAYHCPLPCCRGHESSPAGSFYAGKDGRERWKCHRGGVQGDSLDFVQQYCGLDRPGAVKELTGKTLFELSREWGEQPAQRKAESGPRDNNLNVSSFPPELDARFQPGRPTPEVYSPKIDKRRGYTPSRVYRYFNELGETLLVMLRIDREGGKLTFPVRYVEGVGCVAAGWQTSERRRFYREGELVRRSQDPVLVVEGEKCADLLAQLPAFEDLVVIAWQGGSGAVRRQPWEALRGRTVTFWPDADKVSAEKQELDPEALGAGEKAMLYAADKVGGDHLWMVTPDEEWIAKDIGYDAYDLVQEIGADAARAAMDARRLPYRPPPPPGEEPPEPPPQGRDGRPPDYILSGPTDRRAPKRNEPSNWGEYIRQDARFQHALSFDVLTRTMLCDGRELEPGSTRFHELVHELGTKGPWHSLSDIKVGRYLEAAAREHPVNRVLDAIRGIAWDGRRRELAGYILAEPNTWALAACKRWLLGMMHRILVPGWQHDGVLVLEGPQGRGKTSFFRTMGHIHGFDLYGDLAKLSQDKEVQKILRGKVVVELGEMTAVRAASNSLKQMLTNQYDEYRELYEIGTRKVLRTCVFGGTTNETEYLTDNTGNRRYWIVSMDVRPRLDDLEHDLPQLLAQALVEVEASVQNWLTPEEEVMQEEIAAEREVEDPMWDGLEKVLAGRSDPYLAREDIFEAFGIPRDRRPSNERCKTLSRQMEKLGWRLGRVGSGFQRRRVWFRPPVDHVYPDDDSDIPL